MCTALDNEGRYHSGCIDECFPLIGAGQVLDENDDMVGRFAAYSIDLDNGMDCSAPRDHDRFVRAIEPGEPAANELWAARKAVGYVADMDDVLTKPSTPWQ